MKKTTKQIKVWQGKFGKEYIARNQYTPEMNNKTYLEKFGISKTELYEKITRKLKKSAKILEVGTNIGIQLQILQKLNFKNLYGIDINKEALIQAKTKNIKINFIEGSALDIPFKDNFFDLVFTSGVLIHIAPQDIKDAIKEIIRCTKKYILGFEYYSEKYKTIKYRGLNQLLWKADFSNLFLKYNKNLRLLKKIILIDKLTKNKNIVYLLEKK